MCHFLPVHHLGIAFLGRVEGQNITYILKEIAFNIGDRAYVNLGLNSLDSESLALSDCHFLVFAIIEPMVTKLSHQAPFSLSLSLSLSLSQYIYNTTQSTNYTATYLPSRKLSKLDEPDMQGTAGEAGTSS